ncbi:hypothetical protein JHFBIEKO_5027 [Methylobacterium mesophilicum]|nr:hypothetical protein JHFBIEKO_5027 [Methylobacterium mesophilicum]
MRLRSRARRRGDPAPLSICSARSSHARLRTSLRRSDARFRTAWEARATRPPVGNAPFLQRLRHRADRVGEYGSIGPEAPCCRGSFSVYAPCPISHVPVAACRLVGIRSTAGQPPGVLKDRWSQGWIPTAGIQVATPDPDNNRQPEAKPANPALHGGRSLKQRRTGFFGLVGPPKAGTEEACFSLPGVRWGSSLPIHGSFRVLCARLDRRVSKALRSARRIAP